MALSDTAAADLWKNTLSQIHATFGRLVYLSSLRDPDTGEYRHFGLAQTFGPDEANRVLHDSHVATFNEWLSYNLESQKADLDFYLSGIDGDRRNILETWVRVQPYRGLIPTFARDMEKELYLHDLEVLLDLLMGAYGVPAPAQDA
jgi:hypothetical protein